MRSRAVMVAMLTSAFLVAADKKPDGIVLFNGKDMVGWKLLNPRQSKKSKWSVVKAVKLKDGMPGQFEATSGSGVLLNGGDGYGINLLTTKVHGDCDLHVGVNVAT